MSAADHGKVCYSSLYRPPKTIEKRRLAVVSQTSPLRVSLRVVLARSSDGEKPHHVEVAAVVAEPGYCPAGIV